MQSESNQLTFCVKSKRGILKASCRKCGSSEVFAKELSHWIILQLQQPESNVNPGDHALGVSPLSPLSSGTQRFISYLLLWLSLLYICEQNSNSVNVTAGSCECDRWRVRHSSSSKFSVASLEKSKASRTVAKFAVKHRRIMNSFERQNPRLLEKSLSESKAPRLNDFENKKGKSHCI
ncbi:hypothetical protein HID58_060938 [Brassica napus]|uniref:Uncharacterized protein n=1 Tax=Brassica napus TaxID=3708 RepID=A0ABQ7ZXS5_BRANA|nr:hypothetical protein HID58_060938 [Brassica napus]